MWFILIVFLSSAFYLSYDFISNLNKKLRIKTFKGTMETQGGVSIENI
jgi:hypothetical protein